MEIKDLELSDKAKELLIEASKDPDGLIKMNDSEQGVVVSTNLKTFLDPPRQPKKGIWEETVDELFRLGFIIAIGSSNDTFLLPGKDVTFVDLQMGSCRSAGYNR